MNEALLLREESEDEEFKAGVEPDHVTSKLDNESLLSIMSEVSDALPSMCIQFQTPCLLILNELQLRVNIYKSADKTELSVIYA